jgi:NADH-quinone oxidoreductase subunit G
MLKQGGAWKAVDWQTALEYVANGLRQIKTDHGAQTIGALVSPHSTVEELYLAANLMRGLGSDNIDYRLRNAQFSTNAETPDPQVRWLGTSVASLSKLQRVLVVGSNLRKDHPLFALRVRHAARLGCEVSVINSETQDWAMSIATALLKPSGSWVLVLAEVAAAIALEKGIAPPVAATPNGGAQAIAKSLLGGDRKAILLGNAAAHHDKADSLLALANWIGAQTGARVGYFTEAANTVGAQVANALPSDAGLNAGQMLTAGGLRAALLLNTEPVFDSALGDTAAKALGQCQMVVSLNPFKANMDFCDVVLPIAPFTETSGTFVNAEGRVQSFHAVVKPLADARPGWKVLRVLANMLSLPGFDFESSQAVLAKALGEPALTSNQISIARLSNNSSGEIDLSAASKAPVVAGIYALDGIVRRASSLQMTADAKAAVADGVSI